MLHAALRQPQHAVRYRIEAEHCAFTTTQLSTAKELLDVSIRYLSTPNTISAASLNESSYLAKKGKKGEEDGTSRADLRHGLSIIKSKSPSPGYVATCKEHLFSRDLDTKNLRIR